MEIQEQKIEIDPLEISIMKSLNALPATRNNPFTIFRVPDKIHTDKEDEYEPRAVSIGPYHHNNEKFQHMQTQKGIYLREFLARCQPTSLGFYLNEARALEPLVRKCYRDEFAEISIEDFARMLVLDGCFILELSIKLVRGDNLGFNVRLGTLLSDLLLIENQIPLFVIQKFYDLANATEPVASPHRRDLKELLSVFFLPFNQLQIFGGEVHHLLHLCYQLLVPSSELQGISNSSLGAGQTSPPLTPHPQPKQSDYSALVRIPSAHKLLENGTLLILNRHAQDMFDITYNCGRHELQIPPFHIDSSWKTLYANLLALEETTNFMPENRKMTSLVMLMDCIVCSTKDIQMLKDKHIIPTVQLSEEEILSFFADLRKRLSCEPRKHYFGSIFKDINQRRQDELVQKMAPFIRELFKNHWMLISLTLALFSFMLSLLQAIVAIVQYKKQSA